MIISVPASRIRATGIALLMAVALTFAPLMASPVQAADEPPSTPDNKSGNNGVIAGAPVEVRIQDVTVANGLTTVNFTVRDTRDSGNPEWMNAALGKYRTDVPADDGTKRVGAGIATPQRTSGLLLLDPSKGDVYQVAYTDDMKCMCSEEPFGSSLYPGYAKTFHASFAALPKETSKITVIVPIGGTFIDVPVKHLDSPEPPQSGWTPQGANKEAIESAVHAPITDLITFSNEKDNAARTSNTPDAVVTTLSGDVNFEVDSDQLTPRAKEILDKLAAEWSKKAPSEVTVTGHTDNVADDNHNMDLSKRRAKSVGDYLAGKVRGLKVQTDGKGETAPIADNSSEEGKAANRRVEIRAKE
ncbi:MAG: OmpA family protein [Actinomycetaceae bacterium]|nr:OmpA family protein [Actinomycetaceae bacterium]